MARRLPQVLIASRLQQELDRLLAEILELTGPPTSAADWQPRVDLLESPAGLRVVVELPGVRASEVEVLVEGQEVRIVGRKPARRVGARTRFHCLESGHGTFSRHLRLPRPVDTRRATARLEDGLLTIDLPRIEERRQQVWALPVTEAREIEDE